MSKTVTKLEVEDVVATIFDKSAIGRLSAIVTSPDGSRKEHRQDVAQALANAGMDHVLVLPPGYKLEMLELKALPAELAKPAGGITLTSDVPAEDR